MRDHRFILYIAISMLLAAASPAQELGQDFAYVRFVEGEATLQRAFESEPELLEVNSPILEGDRLWTHRSSRVEVRFDEATVLHVDRESKVDFIRFGREPLLSLWSGRAILRTSSAVLNLRIDTPHGSAFPKSAGTFRIDADPATALSLSVYDGEASLDSPGGRSVLVHSGEQSRVSRELDPVTPYPFDTVGLDDFGAWSESRERSVSRPRDLLIESLPHAVQPYTTELSQYGDWYRDVDYGYVWYPTVTAGWAPYRYGRWCYTRYGYTWVSHDPWGWAPHHYGRWGFNRRGWYWIPGRSWSPAWVSFTSGSFWIGWSPLGYHNSPVFGFKNVFHTKRHAYRKHFRYRGGEFPHDVGDTDGGWNFATRTDFRRRGAVERLHVADVESSAGAAQTVPADTTIGRDLVSVTRKRTDGVSGRGLGSLAPTPLVQSDASARSEVSTGLAGRSARPRVQTPSWIPSPRSTGERTSPSFGSRVSSRSRPSTPERETGPERRSASETRPTVRSFSTSRSRPSVDPPADSRTPTIVSPRPSPSSPQRSVRPVGRGSSLREATPRSAVTRTQRGPVRGGEVGRAPSGSGSSPAAIAPSGRGASDRSSAAGAARGARSRRKN